MKTEILHAETGKGRQGNFYIPLFSDDVRADPDPDCERFDSRSEPPSRTVRKDHRSITRARRQ